jgi:hypothetical protein
MRLQRKFSFEVWENMYFILKIYCNVAQQRISGFAQIVFGNFFYPQNGVRNA